MKNLSKANGTVILKGKGAEVTYVSQKGLVLYVNGEEYYLPYSKFPWFRTAPVSDVFDVSISGKEHLRWEALDVDLSLSILKNPDKYPLIAK